MTKADAFDRAVRLVFNNNDFSLFDEIYHPISSHDLFHVLFHHNFYQFHFLNSVHQLVEMIATLQD